MQKVRTGLERKGDRNRKGRTGMDESGTGIGEGWDERRTGTQAELEWDSIHYAYKVTNGGLFISDMSNESLQ